MKEQNVYHIASNMYRFLPGHGASFMLLLKKPQILNVDPDFLIQQEIHEIHSFEGTGHLDEET